MTLALTEDSHYTLQKYPDIVAVSDQISTRWKPFQCPTSGVIVHVLPHD